ncbi:MAG: transcription antitermination factor NusB [Limibacillus sp.]
MSKARIVALEILQEVLDRGRPLDRVLAEHPSVPAVPDRDQAFLRHLVITSLRHCGEIDALLAKMMKKPLAANQRELRAILRLGAAQILFMSVPPHAAVGETVSLVRGQITPMKGLVNAVLRRLDRERDALLAGLDRARANTPGWLWESWATAYGRRTAREIAEAQLQEPPLDLTVKTDPEGWAKRLGARVLPTGSLRLPPGSGDITKLEGFAEGAWWVQDAAAALPARLLGRLDGLRVADLCAAPGGKTAQLAGAGAQVVAVEKDETRLALLKENLARLDLQAECLVADAADWRPDGVLGGPLDAILLDAPCTATGTIRRHPDIAWLRRPADPGKLAKLQDRLLKQAAALLEPGAQLVYAVCSLQPEEGPQRINALLAGDRGLIRKPLEPDEVGGLSQLITRDGDLRTLPCHLAEAGGMDGFYAARLTRIREA